MILHTTRFVLILWRTPMPNIEVEETENRGYTAYIMLVTVCNIRYDAIPDASILSRGDQ